MKSVLTFIIVLMLVTYSFADYGTFFTPVPDTSAGLDENGIYPQGKKIAFGFYGLGYPELITQFNSRGANFIGPFYDDQAGVVGMASTYGIKCVYHIGIDAETWPSMTNVEITAEITSQVAAVQANEEILAWAIFPEELSSSQPSEMNYMSLVYNAIKAADTYDRPVYNYQAGNMSAANLTTIGANEDMIGIGMYANYSELKHQRVYVKWAMDQITSAVASSNATIPMAILEMFEDAANPTSILGPEDANDIPLWAKHDAYLSLVSGAKFISVFSGSKRNGFYSYYNYLTSYYAVAGELNNEMQLGKVFLFGQPKNDISVTVTSGPSIITLDGGQNLVFSTATGGTAQFYSSLNYADIAYGKERYLVIVNSADQAVSAVISGLPQDEVLVMDLFDSQTITSITGGSFSADFGPWQVKAYRLASVPSECGDLGTQYGQADISGFSGLPDCMVDLYDYAQVASEWLEAGNQPAPIETRTFDFTDGSYAYGDTAALAGAGFSYDADVFPTSNLTELQSYLDSGSYDRPTKNLFAVYNDANWSGTGVAAYLCSYQSNYATPSVYYDFDDLVTDGSINMSLAVSGLAGDIFLKLKSGDDVLGYVYVCDKGAQLNGSTGYYTPSELNIITASDAGASLIYKQYAQGLAISWSVDDDGNNGIITATASYDPYSFGGTATVKSADASFAFNKVPDSIEIYIGWGGQGIGFKSFEFIKNTVVENDGSALDFTDGSYAYGDTGALIDAGFTINDKVFPTSNLAELQSYLNSSSYNIPTKNLFAVYNDTQWSGTGVAAFLCSYEDPYTRRPAVSYSFNDSVTDGQVNMNLAVSGVPGDIYLRLKSGNDIVGYAYVCDKGAQLNGTSGYYVPADFNIITAADAGAANIFKVYAQGLQFSWTVNEDGTNGNLTVTGSYDGYAWGGNVTVKSASAAFSVDKVPDNFEIYIGWNNQGIGFKNFEVVKNSVVEGPVGYNFTDGSYPYGVSGAITDKGFTVSEDVYLTESWEQLNAVLDHNSYDKPTKNILAVYNDTQWVGCGVAMNFGCYDPETVTYPSVYYPFGNDVKAGSVSMNVAVGGRGDAAFIMLKDGPIVLGYVYLHNLGAQFNSDTGYSDIEDFDIISTLDVPGNYSAIFKTYPQDIKLAWSVDEDGQNGIMTATVDYDPYSWGGVATQKTASSPFYASGVPDTLEIHLGYINESICLKTFSILYTDIVEQCSLDLAGDISGPEGDPDCKVDLFDMDAVFNSWLNSTHP